MREKRELDARAARYKERTTRLLHAKTRLFGVDTAALDQQVQEKQERERIEAERDMYYDDMSKTVNNLIINQEASIQAQRRAENMKVNQYREAQAKEARLRELSDRAATEELMYVPTNFLTFGGEDLGNKERTRAQKLQQQDWLAQQIGTLRVNQERELAENASYDEMQDRILQAQKEQAELYELEERRRKQGIVEYNKQMTAERRAKEQQDNRARQEIEDEEVSTALNGRFLNEDTHGEPARSNFKGFTTQQRQEVLDTRKTQLEAAREKVRLEKDDEMKYAEEQERIRRAMIVAERQKTSYATQERLNVAAERTVQAKEKTMRYDYLDNVVYTNPVSEHYFSQFGNDCR